LGERRVLALSASVAKTNSRAKNVPHFVPTPTSRHCSALIANLPAKSCNYLLQNNISQQREILSEPTKLLISFSGVVRD
jgi:hypothetical protein